MWKAKDTKMLENNMDIIGLFREEEYTIGKIQNVQMKAEPVKIALLSNEKEKEYLIYYIIGRDNVKIQEFPAQRDSISEILKFYPDMVIVDVDTMEDSLLKTLLFSFQVSYDYVPVILAGKNKQKLYHFWQYGVFDIINLNIKDNKADDIIDNAIRLKNMLTIPLEEDLLGYLAQIADAKSIEDVGHSKRVSVYSMAIAQASGLHDEGFLKNLYHAAKYHDIGKIALPEGILRKKGTLYKNEYEVVKRHPIIGYYIVTHYGKMDEEVGEMVKHHHEWYNGTGYPDGLKGEEIPLGARIIAIADAYDAITRDRPYRKGKTHDFAISELLKFKGIQFDPQLVDNFIRILSMASK